jgi:hypothetical protein
MPTDAKFRALLVNKDGERQSLAITELAEAAPIWQPPRLGRRQSTYTGGGT